jgi:RNA polymerase sigma factor (sigma-70 family)
MAVRPGDMAAASQVDGWLLDYASSRDPLLRERIILAYLGLADRLADRYRTSRGTTPEDLRQTARAGLIAAIDRYDPDYANPFVAYAVACVIGELKRHLRDTSWRLYVPRPLKEHTLQLGKAADQLQQTLGRSPTIAELAQRLEVAEEDCWRRWRPPRAARNCPWTVQSATTPHAVLVTWWLPPAPGRNQKTSWLSLS